MSVVSALGKVLVANRGEIALRIIRACRELGLHTVAVYSEADAAAPHVSAADEAAALGPAEPARSYLAIDRLIDVARERGATAVHPGYGFLSENAAFAEACTDAGLVFIGPSADTIEALGDKGRARRIAEDAGAPVIPAVAAEGAPQQLERSAAGIGYPVLLKAAAGGGGKGMRVVESADELADALASARREAHTAFGNDAILIEKLIEKPRHIEVQILGDQHGNLLHLGERECSIQRRHQKIIEEAPSVRVDEPLRQRLGRAALAVARATGYHNAGTVEFLLDERGDFYFLEVNTRLQVEHPVTELVTGLDIVHQQLAVAAGQLLQVSQEEIAIRGHAIECRVYAEDPARDFAPSPGEIAVLSEPHMPGVRIDSGVCAGQQVPVHYDPILAKVIAWAPGRPEALGRLRGALEQYVLLGFPTNIGFLRDVLGHPAFVAGQLSTDFLPTHMPSWSPPSATAEQAAIAGALIAFARESRKGASGGQVDDGSGIAADPWQTLGGWRMP